MFFDEGEDHEETSVGLYYAVIGIIAVFFVGVIIAIITRIRMEHYITSTLHSL